MTKQEKEGAISPYHLASSSLTGEAAAAFALAGEAVFLEKRATILEEPAEGAGPARAGPAALRRVPRISEAPRAAGAAAAAMEAMVTA